MPSHSVATSGYVWNVGDLGAVADGATDNRDVLQGAIDACSAAGGGEVVVPTGRFLSSPLVLKSGVTLRITAGAYLLASPRVEDYAGQDPRRCFIWADGAERLAIVGEGTIDGQGAAFFKPETMHLRPRLIIMKDCRDVQIRNVTLTEAGAWTVHLWGCDTVLIDGVTIRNDRERINTDAIDPDCCRHVRIANCHIDAGDDCVVLKTTQSFGEARPCEYITVANNTFRTTCAGLKVGTESVADLRHIAFTNNVIYDATAGISLVIRDGGVLDGLVCTGTVMHMAGHRVHTGHMWPLLITLTDYRYDYATRTRRPTPAGGIRNVVISDLVADSAEGVTIAGIPDHPVEGIVLHDWLLRLHGEPSDQTAPGFMVTYDEWWRREQAAVRVQNARGLTMRNIRVTWEDERAWSFLSCEGVEDVHVDGCRSERGEVGKERATIRLADSRDVLVTNNRFAGGRGGMLRAEGDVRDVVARGNVLGYPGALEDAEHPGVQWLDNVQR